MDRSIGYVSVAIMSVNRPKFASRNMGEGTTDEKVAACDTYLSYCGKYEVRQDEVIHHIEVSLYPNWVGVDQERVLEFDGKRLSLSTRPLIVGGMQQTAYLIWERVKKKARARSDSATEKLERTKRLERH